MRACIAAGAAHTRPDVVRTGNETITIYAEVVDETVLTELVRWAVLQTDGTAGR